MIVDLFSGIRGWECLTAINSLGFDNNAQAITTSDLLGYRTINIDVRDISFDGIRVLDGLIASPPCDEFSASGLGEGRQQISEILEFLKMVGSTTKYRINLSNGAQLLLEPMRWIKHFRPYWIALEQVPSVLPVWEGYAKLLRKDGYSVDYGILGAEQFGLGTTRKRAFLVASREKSVTLPVPTYSAFYPHRPTFLDPGFPKWRSMADVLGWGMTEKPAGTITAGGTKSGGAEPFGNGQRKSMLVEYSNGRWIGPWNPRPSISDLLKLQGFPEGFVVTGNKTAQARQVGNAVLPPVGKLILERLI